MDITTLCEQCIQKCEDCCVDKESELELTVFCNKCPDKGKKELAEQILENKTFYTVRMSNLCEDGSWDIAHFWNRDLAEKYIDIYSKLDDNYTYWIRENKFSDMEIKLDDKVEEYFEYYIYKDEPLSYTENFDFSEKVKRIYDGDLTIQEDNDTIYVWSTNSLEEAKNKAEEIYKERQC